MHHSAYDATYDCITDDPTKAEINQRSNKDATESTRAVAESINASSREARNGSINGTNQHRSSAAKYDNFRYGQTVER